MFNILGQLLPITDDITNSEQEGSLYNNSKLDNKNDNR